MRTCDGVTLLPLNFTVLTSTLVASKVAVDRICTGSRPLLLRLTGWSRRTLETCVIVEPVSVTEPLGLIWNRAALPGGSPGIGPWFFWKPPVQKAGSGS